MNERAREKEAVEDFLPLKSNWFQMLLSLAGGESHGYAIRREVEERTGGRVRLWPATLYGSLARMEEERLIEEVDAADEPDDDLDRVYYRLTPLGRAVLESETERLEELVRFSRARMAEAGS